MSAGEGNQGKGVERVKGIEPSYAAWEAAVLPLNYTRIGENAIYNSRGPGAPVRENSQAERPGH